MDMIKGAFIDFVKTFLSVTSAIFLILFYGLVLFTVGLIILHIMSNTFGVTF